jgi:general secretion pathway protein E
MIGEVRDLETAEIAIQSALTGHLVFSTLHTNDAPTAITRLLDMGVEHFLLSSTVRGILAQRLVRMICPECRQRDDSPATREEARKLHVPDSAPLFKGIGCEACSQSGFFGRTGIYELLVVDEEIRKMVVRNVDSNQLRATAINRGMKTLLRYGIERAVEGVTTIDEVLRVTQEV